MHIILYWLKGMLQVNVTGLCFTYMLVDMVEVQCKKLFKIIGSTEVLSLTNACCTYSCNYIKNHLLKWHLNLFKVNDDFLWPIEKEILQIRHNEIPWHHSGLNAGDINFCIITLIMLPEEIKTSWEFYWALKFCPPSSMSGFKHLVFALSWRGSVVYGVVWVFLLLSAMT